MEEKPRILGKKLGGRGREEARYKHFPILICGMLKRCAVAPAMTIWLHQVYLGCQNV